MPPKAEAMKVPHDLVKQLNKIIGVSEKWWLRTKSKLCICKITLERSVHNERIQKDILQARIYFKTSNIRRWNQLPEWKA
nr:hypothetical protein [Providencia rettgeri]